MRQLATLLISILLATPLLAAESDKASESGGAIPGIDISLNAALASNYVLRGQVLTDGLVFQPAASVGFFEGFSLGVWGNLDIDNENGRSGEFTEVDYIADYTFDLPIAPITLSFGAMSYTYPSSNVDNTAEAYVKAEWDLFINPRVSIYYNFVEVDGLYASFELTRSILGLPNLFNAMAEASLDATTGIGFGSADYNHYYFGVDDDAFNDLFGELSINASLFDTVSASVFVRYTALIDSEIRDAVADANVATIGAKFSLEF